MARDHRRTNSTRPSKRYTKPAPKNAPNGFKWTFVGILVGLLIAIALFWEYAPSLLHATSTKRPLSPIPTHHAAAKKENTNPSARQSHAPQFDFYTLLPKAQVDASSTALAPPVPTPVAKKTTAPTTAPTVTSTAGPAPAAETPTAPTPSRATSNPPTIESPLPSTTTKPATTPEEKATNHTGKYMLQVASVKNYSEADRLKAQLSMLGLNVSIQKSTVNGEVWNRVFAGPFSSKQQALEKQQTLRENSISSMVVKQ